jgi:hypothetical protein
VYAAQIARIAFSIKRKEEDSKADEEEATPVATEPEEESTMPLYEVSRILDKRVNPETAENHCFTA